MASHVHTIPHLECDGDHIDWAGRVGTASNGTHVPDRATVDIVTTDPWREKLTDAEYRVLRQGGTEPAFTGEYTDTETAGVYVCRACGAELFSSDTKYHSGCGWPSFADAKDAAVTLHEDRSFGVIRTEVRCANCDSHLGHLFSGEGLAPKNLPDERYCINSISLSLRSE